MDAAEIAESLYAMGAMFVAVDRRRTVTFVSPHGTMHRYTLAVHHDTDRIVVWQAHTAREPIETNAAGYAAVIAAIEP